MKRPKRITAICVIFCLLTLAGFGDSVVLISGELSGAPQWLGFLTLVFGITAGAATIGLWRMKCWGVGVVRAWTGTTVVLFVGVAYLFVEVSPGGLIGITVTAVVIAGLLIVINRYVSATVRAIT